MLFNHWVFIIKLSIIQSPEDNSVSLQDEIHDAPFLKGKSLSHSEYENEIFIMDLRNYNETYLDFLKIEKM